MKNILTTIAAFVLLAGCVFAQDEGKDEPAEVQDIFYGTRAINLHTVKQLGKNVLAYRISHRLGSMRNNTFYNFFGIDGPANISMMIDYGIRDNLQIGIARDQFNKVYNGYVKYRIFKQEHGGMPITLTAYSKANMTSLRNVPDDKGFGRYDNFAHRMSYVTQLMVARKFGERFAVQVAPTYIHHNLVESAEEKNGMFAVSGAAQLKITKRFGISGEYTYVINDYAAPTDTYYHSASIGMDIVTGGHIFQFHLINSSPINETFAIPYTTSNWLDGDFRLGFNISRNFWL